jgi:hypothetical protein
VSRWVDSVGSLLVAPRANFREAKRGALKSEKLRINSSAEHNGAIAVSKLCDCSIRLSMLFSR